jgi:hypothetical protein
VKNTQTLLGLSCAELIRVTSSEEEQPTLAESNAAAKTVRRDLSGMELTSASLVRVAAAENPLPRPHPRHPIRCEPRPPVANMEYRAAAAKRCWAAHRPSGRARGERARAVGKPTSGQVILWLFRAEERTLHAEDCES